MPVQKYLQYGRQDICASKIFTASGNIPKGCRLPSVVTVQAPEIKLRENLNRCTGLSNRIIDEIKSSKNFSRVIEHCKQLYEAGNALLITGGSSQVTVAICEILGALYDSRPTNLTIRKTFCRNSYTGTEN